MPAEFREGSRKALGRRWRLSWPRSLVRRGVGDGVCSLAGKWMNPAPALQWPWRAPEDSEDSRAAGSGSDAGT